VISEKKAVVPAVLDTPSVTSPDNFCVGISWLWTAYLTIFVKICICNVRKRKAIQEVVGRTSSLLSFGTIRTAYKTTPPAILRCRGNVFTELLRGNDRGIRRPTDACVQGYDRSVASEYSYFNVACIRCRGNVFTEPLRSSERGITLPNNWLATIGGIHIQAHTNDMEIA
jgi:hypothetical protein